MPILHIAPSPDAPPIVAGLDFDPLLAVALWQQPLWNATMETCPPNAVMDVTPPHWGKALNFILHVAESGEEAELMSVQNQNNPQAVAEAIERGNAAIGSKNKGLATATFINEEREVVFIAKGASEAHILLGGVLLYVRQGGMELMRGMYPNHK